MTEIELVLPHDGARRWHLEIARRLAAPGRTVTIVRSAAGDRWPATVSALLSLEKRLSRGSERLWEPAAAGFEAADPAARLRIDLSGGASPPPGVLALRFDGSASASMAATSLLQGRLPVLELLRDGVVVARAEPMIDGRFQLGRGLDDVLARAVSLVVASASRLLDGEAPQAAAPPVRSGPVGGRGPAAALAFSAAPRALGEMTRRLRHWPSHWRVGYRFHDGPGVAELGQIGGPDWSILPDDGRRYYADPFAVEHRGRHCVFVEEYPHASGKGIISMAEFDRQGRPSTPVAVLEEPHHLSYPQVFERGGRHFMLPEAGASNALTLYRADRFPHGWRPHAVLIEGRALFDATLLDHGGRLWLLATERDGAGSSSDMLVAFFAERIEGPWTPHPANPVLIDRAAARQGGAFVRVGRRIVRPVQDGTEIYGGGLGLSDLVRLDERAVEFSRPVPVLGMRSWPYPRIHTLNRAGRLEVIDGLAEVRRVRGEAA